MDEAGAPRDVAALARASRYEGRITFEITEKSADRVQAVMPVGDGIRNPFGTVHAGALLWFADVTATVLALEHSEVTPDGKGFPLALNLNAQLIGNSHEGNLTAEALFVRKGRRISVIRTTVRDSEGRTLVDVTTTHMPA